MARKVLALNMLDIKILTFKYMVYIIFTIILLVIHMVNRFN